MLALLAVAGCNVCPRYVSLDGVAFPAVPSPSMTSGDPQLGVLPLADTRDDPQVVGRLGLQNIVLDGQAAPAITAILIDGLQKNGMTVRPASEAHVILKGVIREIDVTFSGGDTGTSTAIVRVAFTMESEGRVQELGCFQGSASGGVTYQEVSLGMTRVLQKAAIDCIGTAVVAIQQQMCNSCNRR